MINRKSILGSFSMGFLMFFPLGSLRAQNPSVPVPTPPAGGYPSSLPAPAPNPPDMYDLQNRIGAPRITEPPAKPVTMKELEDILTASRDASDAKLASILSGVYLTERVTAARLAGWNAAFAGSKTREAFVALADASAFEPLPAMDVPTTATPTLAEQKQMMVGIGNYLGKVLPTLPNLIATRSTTYFEDHPSAPGSQWAETPSTIREAATDNDPASTQLHWPLERAESSKIQVSNVNGKESTMKGALEPARYAARLTTAGEFGPILYGVMMDATHGNLRWAGWEPGKDGPLAAFRFDATKENSHFSLRQHAAKGQSQFAAYSGTFTIRPSDGAIVRLVVVAHPESDDRLAEAKLMVEYGLVDIGGRMYLCPVHGVALSRLSLYANSKKGHAKGGRLQTHLNDIAFDQYHVFRSNSRMVEGLSADLSKPMQPGAAAPQKPGTDNPAPPEAAPQSPAWTDAVAEVTAPPEPAATGSAPEPADVEASKPSAPSQPQPTAQAMATSTAPPIGMPVESPEKLPAVAPSLRMSVDLVLVPVVVRDARSLAAIGGLTKNDFQIFDNKKAQEITSFMVEKTAGPQAAGSTSQTGPGENVEPVTPANATEPRLIVYLFDDIHLKSADLLPLRNAALHNLESLRTNDLAALISTSGKVVLSLTNDREKLKEALMQIHAAPLTGSTQAECPDISYFMALKIRHESDDGETMATAMQETINCRVGLRNMQATQPRIGEKVALNTVKLAVRRAQMAGEQESRTAIARTKEVVDWLAKMPGRKIIILISPGFLVDTDKQSDIADVIEKAIRADVAISAIDARGLSGLDPSRDINKAVTHSFEFAHMMSQMAAEEATEIPYVLGELADGTGGEFIKNTGDFSWAFQRLLSPPEFTYILGFKPTKRDGKLHELAVKLTDKKGLELQSRQAYVASKQ
jgi:VWFA-related protein